MRDSNKIVVAPMDLFGCGFIRVIVPYSYLKSDGYDITFVESTSHPAHQDCGVMLAQRPMEKPVVDALEYFKSQGVKIIIEYDDIMHAMVGDEPRVKDQIMPRLPNFERAIRLADALSVSTPDLKREYESWGKPIFVTHNAIHDNHFARWGHTPITGEFKVPGEIRIGWAGGDWHKDDLMTISGPVSRILREYPQAKFIFVGQPYLDYFADVPDYKKRVIWAGHTTTKPLQLHDIKDDMDYPSVQWYDLIEKSKLDIALAPLVPNRFNCSKSFNKVCEYGMGGIPVVARTRFSGNRNRPQGPYGHYAKWAGDAEVLLGANSDREWYEQIKRLIENQDDRVRLAKANRRFVHDEHLMSKRVHEYDAMFSFLGVQRPGQPVSIAV